MILPDRNTVYFTDVSYKYPDVLTRGVCRAELSRKIVQVHSGHGGAVGGSKLSCVLLTVLSCIETVCLCW